jgi:polysaccharide export outer membrane protein
MWARGARVMAAWGMAFFCLVSPSFGAEPSKGTPSGEAYVIEPGDHLEVFVWKESDLTRDVIVRKDGKISLPLVDEVQAAGLTPLDLKKVITGKLGEYLSDPRVSVIVKFPTETASQKQFKVYVLGNVARPGNYETTHKITVLQAIALAGGLNEWASSKFIVISGEGGKETRKVIHYKDVIAGESLEENTTLKSGDTIVVP